MKLKRLCYAVVLAVMLASNFGGLIFPAMADNADPSVQNPSGPTVVHDEGGDIKLYKTAKSVPGYANKWEVTLRIESPKTETTSDTVLVIDHSASMEGSRLTNAKEAAGSLVTELLPEGNTLNRVAVVSYGTDVTTNSGFTTDSTTVLNAINSISAQGGTFTQGGLHVAANLLSGSTATYKNIILLSDGAPSYSYGIKGLSTDNANMFDNEDGPGLHTYEYQTKVVESADDFNYNTRVGDGSRYNSDPVESEMWDLFDYECHDQRCRNYDYYYYNHGNAAISEANFYKASGVGGLYTIAFNAGTKGNRVLNGMADAGKAYTAAESNLKAIFDQIAGDITALIKTASVQDIMGHGVKVSGSNNTSIEWSPEFELDPQKDVYVAEKSYEVEMDESVYEQNSANGFYDLNESAILTYNDGKTGEFPVPKAKPFAVKVRKELVHIDGKGNETVKNDEKFTFKISGNDKEYTVVSGGQNVIRVPMPIKLGTEYEITETGAVDESQVKFENYKVEYPDGGNKFIVTADHGDEINIKIKNTYAMVDVSASKTWADDDDRDGLRSEYGSLYVAVKDGSKYVAMEKLAAEDGNYVFENLPKYRNNAEIKYDVVEAKDCSVTNMTCAGEFAGDNEYAVTIKDGAITNTHTPKTKDLIIKKSWDVSSGTLPTVAPSFIMVELSNDENNEKKPIRLEGNGYGEWQSEAISVPVYKNHGQEIKYEVKETGIGANNNLVGDKNDTLYVYNGEVLEGKWTAENAGSLEVKNTWQPATSEYEGKTEFEILKVNDSGDTLSGVVFTVGNSDYTTNKSGKVKIETELSATEPTDEKSFVIREKSTIDGYDLVNGTATLDMACESKLESVDEAKLVNTFTKSCEYTKKNGSNAFVWDSESGVLTVVNNRSLAESMKIRKEFSGVTAEALKNNGLKFDLTGPADFAEQEIGFDKFTKVSDNVYEYTVNGRVPSGEYKVVESGAEFEDLLNLTVSGDNDVVKNVESGDNTVFTIKNDYAKIRDVSYEVKKVWEDGDNRDGKRPENLSVTLLRDGKVYKTTTLNEENGWDYKWTDLPRAGSGATLYEYKAVEADIADYESDEGVLVDGVMTFTNKYTPETKDITIKKLWNQGDLLNLPGAIIVELMADGEVAKTVDVLAGTDGAWTYTFDDLFVYEDGEEIQYSVREKSISGATEGTFIVYGNDEVGGQKSIEGKWVAETNGFEITNTWVPATSVYEGEADFTIVKINEDSETLEGVKFDVNGEKYKTDANGEIKIDVPISNDGREESFEFKVKEKEALKGYELVEGSATVSVVCTSALASVDEASLVNAYEKTCEYEKSGSDGYTWNDEERELVVVNVESIEAPTDPCADGGGCGGTYTVPSAPETGLSTHQSWSNNDVMLGNSMVVAITIGAFTTLIIATRTVASRKRK